MYLQRWNKNSMCSCIKRIQIEIRILLIRITPSPPGLSLLLSPRRSYEHTSVYIIFTTRKEEHDFALLRTAHELNNRHQNTIILKQVF